MPRRGVASSRPFQVTDFAGVRPDGRVPRRPERRPRRIASEGALFATRVIRATLKCTQGIADCQIQCEEGVFGPPCDPVPQPGCCDPDDPSSNATFGACMDEAQAVCDEQTAKIDTYELNKQTHITLACEDLTPDELCGSQAEGLNFATLNAGCLALDPTYVCNLPNLVACVGGPLERALVDQISATLDPRAPEAVAALNLQSHFPDIPITRKVKDTVPTGKVDVWSITGQAGDQIVVRVRTGDDNGNDTSSLHPGLTLLQSDGTTPVGSTNVRNVDCPFPNVCGSKCPLLKRTLPFDGTFHLAVSGVADDGCSGGKYRLLVTSPGGSVPQLVRDDADPTP